MPQPRFIQQHLIDPAALAAEAAAGLSTQPASVSPKFFYDALGSRLFDAITELDEYELTRTEAALFDRHGADIVAAMARCVGRPATLVDLGAGSGEKAARLFGHWRPDRYVAVDIAVDHLRCSLPVLQRRFEAIEMVGVGLDFSERLALPAGLVEAPALVFYPGSSIGNFAPRAARRLLREARAAARGGALLIGVDLVKDKAKLDAAYDDALGVTAAFNLNLLRHLNRLLGADFDPRQWRHLASYDPAASRVEMHLQARRDVVVRWRGGQRAFAAGERIHTENSYKWHRQDFEALLREAGFGAVQCWSDADLAYALMVASG